MIESINVVIKLLKDYFIDSEDRYIALLLLFCAILSVLGVVFVAAQFASWSVVFWAALSDMNMPLYMASIQTFVILTASYIGLSILNDYLVGVLTIRWRNWLTAKLIVKYTSEEGNNYLDLERHASEIENPAQRIQEEVVSFVEKTVSLGIRLLKSVLTALSFLGQLWVIGGAITIAGITIPGYLVWIAILYSAVAAGLIHLVGHLLAPLNNEKQNLEADFRENIDYLGHHAESIAQDHGEEYYQQSLNNNLRALNENSYRILGVRINLNAFYSFYEQMSELTPYILAAPVYFSGGISFGEFMAIGYAFSQIQSSLDWFTNSYEDFAQYSVSAKRIVELRNSMSENGLTTTSKLIAIQNTDSDELSIRNLDIAYPTSSQFMMRQLNLTLRSGENTLIKGPSGLGKSTLFKVMAGTWKYGSGDVLITNNKRLCFLPQRPSLPNDSLKAVLAYPESADTYTTEQCEAVLREVGDFDKYIGALNTKAAWSKRLSLGQQQRLSFARALLKQPDWLFLDEATASLDEDSEYRMYRLVKDKLPNTTFVSIAHRSTVTPFHNRVLTFSVDEYRVMHLGDEQTLMRSAGY